MESKRKTMAVVIVEKINREKRMAHVNVKHIKKGNTMI